MSKEGANGVSAGKKAPVDVRSSLAEATRESFASGLADMEGLTKAQRTALVALIGGERAPSPEDIEAALACREAPDD